MSTTRDGLTLIEILVSVALLGSVLLGAAEWVRAASDVSVRFDRNVRFEQAARATLDAIEQDLEVGNEVLDHRDPVRDARVVVKDGVLTIKTREPGIGAVTRVYDLRSITAKASGDHELVRTSRGGAGAGSADATSLLLGAVSKWSCSLTEIAHSDPKRNELRVAIVDAQGRKFERAWSVR